MAEITTNKILLKDSKGNILLPITRSVFVEISSAAKQKFVKVVNETEVPIQDVDEALTYLHDWQTRQDGKLNNLINSINEELPGAFTAYNISFDNSKYTSYTSPLYNGGGETPAEYDTSYVQGAIEAIENSLSQTLDTVSQLITTAGVTDAVGSYAITVTGSKASEEGKQQGSLSIGLNLADGTLVQDANGLRVSYIEADQVMVPKGAGDDATLEPLDETLSYINVRLSEAATAGNLAELTGRVTTVEGKVDTLEDQIDNIGITKSSYSGDYAAVYTFTNYNGDTTEINIPKDQFLQTVRYVPLEQAPENAQPGDYPAIEFTWIVDNDDETASPTSAKTIIPVSDLIDSVNTKADEIIEILGVERDQNDHIVVTPGSSAAITGKDTIEEQIEGLDAALQGVDAIASTALQGVEFNGKRANVDDNIAYINATGSDITISYITTYETAPNDVSAYDSIDTAISKILYNESRIEAKIKLDFIDGGSTYVEPITNGFAGINY